MGAVSSRSGISPRSTISRPKSPSGWRSMISLWWNESRRSTMYCRSTIASGRRFAENVRAIPRRAKQLRVSRRHGTCATDVAPDVREPQLHHRSRCRDRRGRCRGVLIAHGDATSGLQPLCQGWPFGSRPQYRRRPRDRHLRARDRRPARIGLACMSNAWCARRRRPRARARGSAPTRF